MTLQNKKINVAGSIFIGSYTCGSILRLCKGTNFTRCQLYGYMPANYSGVSVDSFVNMTLTKATAQGIQNPGPAVEKWLPLKVWMPIKVSATEKSLNNDKRSVLRRLTKKDSGISTDK
jgi:histidinol dehydrogenase